MFAEIISRKEDDCSKTRTKLLEDIKLSMGQFKYI